MTLNPPEVPYLSYADARKIENEVAHRRNALRQQILSGDYDAIKACLADWGDDWASDFVREVVGLIGHDEPTKDTAEVRYWLIRRAAEKWLRAYLETAVDADAVELEMKRDGLI